MDLSREVALNKGDIFAKIVKAEEYYKSLEPLYLLNPKSEKVILLRKHTAKTFVEKFLLKFNEEPYKTMYKKSNNVYCTSETRRSIGDIFRVAYSYLGDKITLLDIIKEVYLLNMNSRIGSNYCYTINKRVYKDRKQKNGCYHDDNHYDELGFTKAHYQLITQ